MCATLVQGLFQMAVDVKAYFDRCNTSWTLDKLDNKPCWSVSRKSLCFKTNQRPKNSVLLVSIYFSFLYLFLSVFLFFFSKNTFVTKCHSHQSLFTVYCTAHFFSDRKNVVLFLLKLCRSYKIFSIENKALCPWNNQNLTDSCPRWRSHTPLRLRSLLGWRWAGVLGRVMPARSSR